VGSEARARLGLIGLAFITLLSFNQLFGQQEFAGPSLLAMLVATGMALLCRRLGLWPVTTIGVSSMAMVWYLVVIFQAPHTFYGLPTINSIRRLGVAINRAYEHSQIDFSPVPLRPGYAILTVAAMWMLVTIGEVATFRWRRPLIASIPPIGLFAFLMIVGTQEGTSVVVILFLAALLTYWALESAHRLRSWGRWVPVWKGQKVEDPTSITGGLARRMGVSCVAAALVLPAFLPVIEEGLVSWRSDRGSGGGFGAGGLGSSGEVDPLVSLVPRLINQSEDEMFRVRSDEAAYWRLLTLNRFDGIRWTDVSNNISPVPASGSVPIEMAPPVPGRVVNQTFTITGLGGNEVPFAGVPLTISVPEYASGNVYVDPFTADLQLGGEVEEGFRYDVQAVVPDANFDDLKKAEVGGVAIGSDYLAVPELSPAVLELVEEWTKGAKTGVEKLAAIQSRLRGFDYSLDIDQPTSANYLEEFLLTNRVGYCQQFATAFAILARHLGFPTRVAVGFLPGETDSATPDTYVVTGNETHAWPEVLFAGYGWVPFEPTPRSESPEPLYTLEEVAAAPSTISGAEAPTSEPGQRGRAQVQGDGGPRTLNNRQTGGAGGSGRNGGPVDARWQDTFAKIALALCVLAILFLALVPLLKKLRIERRYARATDTRGRAAAAFAEFQQEAAELASPRLRAESAASYAQRVGREARLPASATARLASIYEAAEYSPRAVSDTAAEEARRLARQLRSKLWSEAGWWRRIKRLWSPTSLAPARRVPVRRLALQRVLSLGRS
jgi:transglutaminase-like putative cysteine protease